MILRYYGCHPSNHLAGCAAEGYQTFDGSLICVSCGRHMSIEEQALDVKAPLTALSIALAELGVEELAGDKHNPRIIEYHQSTTLKATDDETPWCSSFVNWCILKYGEEGTNSARAKSWMHWGKPAPSLLPGDVVVLQRAGNTELYEGPGHVGICNDPATNTMVAGNVSDGVKIQRFDPDKVIAIRRLA